LCQSRVAYLGLVLEKEMRDPILMFPLPKTLKQLRDPILMFPLPKTLKQLRDPILMFPLPKTETIEGLFVGDRIL
jgi:hypothetical protein